MSHWLTAAELAGLPGMPGSEFRTRAKLDKLGVPSRLRSGRQGGGGREFDAAHLPPETRAALLLQATAPSIPSAPALPDASTTPLPTSQPTPVASPVVAPAPGLPAKLARLLPAAPATARPPTRQEAACADARLVLVQQLDQITPLCGGLIKAADQLVAQLAAGVAAPALVAAARLASARPRPCAVPTGAHCSARSLLRWRADHAAGGWHALLPQPTDAPVPTTLAPDVAAVLQRYATAQGSGRNLTHCAQAVNLEQGNPFDDWRALCDRARRALAKLDKAKLVTARHTGAQRAAKLPFKRRDASVFAPLDIGVCDGHSFKAKVRHPIHGQPFTPEVTLVMDVATRKVTGWSVDLSESTIAVGAAMRHSTGQHGVFALMYTDNGSGERAKYFDCDLTGVFARLGTDHKTGRPRHPQGHGVIERSWQTHMIRCARQFATYSGSDADDGTYKDTAAALAREQRAVKRARADGNVVALSSKCPSWQQFLDAVSQAVGEYNATHRHRGLPRHAEGPHAGKHMTPDEAWAHMLVPELVTRLDAPTLRDVFMPARLATAIRGEVRFMNQHYFAPELMQHDGSKVRVHYDIHDPARVWVWGLDGRYICEAQWGANRIDFFPKAVVEMAREKRVRAALARLDAKRETAERELRPALDVPGQPLQFIGDAPAGVDLPMVERVDAPAPAQAQPQAGGRPFFDSASDRYEWLCLHPAEATPADTAWMAAYEASPDFEALRDYYVSRGLIDDPGAAPPAFDRAG